MEKKNSPINIMVSAYTKKKLKAKAEETGLSLTGFFEKIANEDIAFLDENFKKVAKMFKMSM